MEKDTNQSRYKIPQDILMDILRIIFRNNVKYTITGIKEKENSLFLTVNYAGIKNSMDVKNNIEGILEDYVEYMKGIISDSTLMMDEDQEDD